MLKSGFMWLIKVVKSGFMLLKWFFMLLKWLYSVKSGFMLLKWFYVVKVVLSS